MNNITKQEFDEKINTENKMIITISANWCGPCRMLAPVLEKLSEEYTDINFYKADAEKERALTEMLGITGVPTILFYSEGELKYKHVGATSSSVLKKYIEENL